jgi:hypothetical protein
VFLSIVDRDAFCASTCNKQKKNYNISGGT